jgi:hypothetical protein
MFMSLRMRRWNRRISFLNERIQGIESASALSEFLNKCNEDQVLDLAYLNGIDSIGMTKRQGVKALARGMFL